MQTQLEAIDHESVDRFTGGWRWVKSLGLAIAVLAAACSSSTDGNREVSESVTASQQTRRELGVERWVVYAEARTYGLRVVGLDDRGSLRGAMIFTLSYPPGGDRQLEVQFGDGKMVIDPDGNVVSNSLSSDEWTRWMNAAERDLDAHPAVQSSANCAVALVGGAVACAGGAATCTSILLCFLGGAACGVGIANAYVECFPEETPPPLCSMSADQELRLAECGEEDDQGDGNDSDDATDATDESDDATDDSDDQGDDGDDSDDQGDDKGDDSDDSDDQSDDGDDSDDQSDDGDDSDDQSDDSDGSDDSSDGDDGGDFGDGGSDDGSDLGDGGDFGGDF